VSYVSHIIKTVPQFSVYRHTDNNESKVIRILAFLCDALLVLCLSFCPYFLVALKCDRRKCWSSVSADIWQRRTVRTL